MTWLDMSTVTCKRCLTALSFERVKADIIEDDLYFFCPRCRHENTLVNVAKFGRTLLLRSWTLDTGAAPIVQKASAYGLFFPLV